MPDSSQPSRSPSAWSLLLRWGVLTNLMLVALIVLAECVDLLGAPSATAIAAAVLAVWATVCAGLGLAAILPMRRWREGGTDGGF